ncbi:glutathione S-transferase [Photobacterium indicum]|jgi:glutathione S-transferase|uniref:Glutathione S-transferase n=1 Tax=Photobacterium indicum TaxID=81447 RepID=A0A2T3L5S3_9GAMM|nr:glutathione S-transferase [Photobacterium indicum]PSV45255.1 glutathione S-transferase [Photobacterium indicum]
MKIYELAPAPSARRVSIYLAEMGIDVERANIDIRGGENLSEAFQAISLNGRIPVLELDDGTTICESIAICRYFDSVTQSKTSLFGDTPIEQAKIEMWQRMVEFQGLYAAFQAFRNITGIYEDRETCVTSWGHESRQRVIDFLPVLNKQLATSAYIAGDKFSVADITAFVMCGFIKNLEIEVDDSLPNLLNWFDRVSQRASVQG